MKRLEYLAHKGVLVVPGEFKLAAGESRDISDDLADKLAAQRHLNIQISDAPSRVKRQESQPEAHEGEGQPTANDLEKE